MVEIQTKFVFNKSAEENLRIEIINRRLVFKFMISLQANGVRFDNIQGIILDKDGTLTDSNFYWKEIIIDVHPKFARILH